MRKLSVGLAGLSLAATAQTNMAGSYSAYRSVSISSNLDWQTDQRGMTPQGMCRIIMVALLVLGPYLGFLFPVNWPAPAVDASAASVSNAAQTSAATNASSVAQAGASPQRPGMFGPFNNATGLNSMPKIFPASSATCFYDPTQPPPIIPLTGVRGDAKNFGGGTISGTPVTVTLLDVNNNFANVSQYTNPAGGAIAMDNTTPGAPSDKILILQYDASGYLRTYFDYYLPGSPNFSGRYDRASATRVYFRSSDCTAYALVPNPLPVGHPIPLTDTVDLGLVNWLGVTMTNGTNGAGNRKFDVAMVQQAGFGGRVFLDDGTNNPPPLYTTIGSATPSVNVYTSSNGTIGSVPVATTNVDEEGYYIIGGTGAAVLNGTFVLKFSGAVSTGILDTYYCNYAPGSQTVNPANMVPVNVVASPSQLNYTVTSGDPRVTGSTPPCKTNSGNLSIPGLHAVIRTNKQITGTISLDPSVPAGTTVDGAYAVAYRYSDDKVGGTSNTVTSADHNYTIEGLQPGTAYYVRFFAPPVTNPLTPPEAVGQYYGGPPFTGQTLDTPKGSFIQINTPAGANNTPITNINAKLQPGAFFSGQVGFFGVPGPTTKDVTVQVFRQADLLQANPQPVDTVNTRSDGTYDTHKMLEPGQTYVLAFRPFGGAQSYIAAWCGPTAPNCAAAPDSSGAQAFLIIGGDTIKVANINLSPGVVLNGTLYGSDINITFPYSLGALGTNVSVYVYKVNIGPSGPISPTLVQLFNVTGSGATFPYTTSALFVNTDYVLKYVPTNPPTDPGFRSAYYTSAFVTGTTLLSGAEPINKPLAQPYTLNNISLVRASGISVTLLTYLGGPYSSVRVDVFDSSQYPPGPGVLPRATGTTDSNGQLVLTGLDPYPPTGNPYHIRFSPTGQRATAWYTTTLSGSSAAPVTLPVGAILAINFTMPPFVAVGGQILPVGINWAGSSVRVLDANKVDFGTFTNGPSSPVAIQDSAPGLNNWTWDAFLPPGTYYFSIVPSSSAVYVPHWWVANNPNGADPNLAQPVLLDPSFPNNGVSITFVPGGVVRVYVNDYTFAPVVGANVGFYDSQANLDNGITSFPTVTTSGLPPSPPGRDGGTGTTFSRPRNAPVWIQVTPSAGNQVESGSVANQAVAMGQTQYVTITLPPTPFITGFVKSRGLPPNLNTEYPDQNLQVTLVDPTSNVQLPGAGATTLTDNNGYYSLRLPQGPFKLKFSAASRETRYWFNTPQQTGTKEFTLATVIQKQSGRIFANYNQIYDFSVTTTPNGCRITDMYVISTTLTTAQIRYLTNCQGTTQLGWSIGTPTPGATWSAYIASGTFISVTDPGGPYTHTATITGLSPDTNYYVRPFSQMPLTGGTIIGADVELHVRTSADGKSWYFAGGNTTSAAPVSTTEVLHLFNYTNSPTTAFVHYYTTTGGVTPTPKQVNLPAQGRVDVQVYNPADAASLASTGYSGFHSTLVTASQGIMVEKSQTMIGNINGYAYSGGYSIPGATSPSNLWFFPEISTNAAKEQVISLLNPSPTITACVRLTYQDGSSTGLVRPNGTAGNPQYLVMAPNTRFQFIVGADVVFGPGQANLELGLKVTTANYMFPGYNCTKTPVVAEVETHYAQATFDLYHKGVAGMMGASGSSQRWYFLDGQSDKPYDVQYSVLNTNGNIAAPPAIVTITASIDNPATGNIALTKQITFTVPANKRVSFSIPSTLFNQGASGQRFGFTAQVDASDAVVVQRSVRYLYSSSPALTGLYHEIGVTRASSQWLFAAGDTIFDSTTRKFTEEALNIYNSNPAAVTLTITYYTDTGVQVFNNFVVAPYSRINVQPSANASPTYPSVGVGRTVAIKVDSGGVSGIFAERLVYWRKGNTNGGNAIYGWYPSGY